MDDICQCPIKLTLEDIKNGMNRFGVVMGPPDRSPANIKNFRGDSNAVERKEYVDYILDLDDENICQKSDVDKKHINDLKEILSDVVNLVFHGVNEDLPNATVIRLRTLSISVRQKINNLMNTCEESVIDEERTAIIPSTSVEVKRVLDVNECTIEQSTLKKTKTEHKYDEHNKRSTTTSTSSLKEENTLAAQQSNANYLKIRKTSEPTTTNKNENNEVQLKKFEYSKVVLKMLTPYYKKNYFATKKLFQFLAKTIVHRLIDTKFSPDKHTIKSKIKLMMPETKIESKDQILKMLKPFF